MEVNNNNEINKMFGTEDNPVKPPAEDAYSPPSDPEAYHNTGVASFDGEHALTDDSDNTSIGDHERFGFAQKREINKTFPLVIITLLIGIALGGFLCYTYFFGLHLSGESSAAVAAISAIDDYAAEKFGSDKNIKVVYSGIYVNNKVTEYDCVVFAQIRYSNGNYASEAFHLTIDKESDFVSVFAESDMNEYEALVAAGDDSSVIKAQILQNRFDKFNECLYQIRAENENWTYVEPLFLKIKMIKF